MVSKYGHTTFTQEYSKNLLRNSLNKNAGFDKHWKTGAAPENWKYLANTVPRS